MQQRELVVRGAFDRRKAGAGRLRVGRWRVLGGAVVAAVGVLGLSACVADAAPIMGATVAGDGEATVSWSAPPGDNGALITSYVVIPYVGAAAQPRRTFASNATTQVLTGLTNGTTYTFVVYGRNHLGNDTARSAMSAPVTPELHYTWAINLDSIEAAGGGSVIFLESPIPLDPCSVSAGIHHRCEYSVPGGEDIVMQALPDDESNEIFWGGGCASVFGDNGDKCRVLWTVDGFDSNVDLFFLVP